MTNCQKLAIDEFLKLTNFHKHWISLDIYSVLRINFDKSQRFCQFVKIKTSLIIPAIRYIIVKCTLCQYICKCSQINFSVVNCNNITAPTEWLFEWWYSSKVNMFLVSGVPIRVFHIFWYTIYSDYSQRSILTANLI